MRLGFIKHIILFFKIIGLYFVLLGMIAVMVTSCGGSKQTSAIRQIEKHSKKYPVGEDGLPVPTKSSDSKKAREAIAKQQKQQEALEKEAQKAYQDAITRHREIQTPEVRDRMDQHLKETNKRYSTKKEFFLVRWLRPKDNIEKIEKRRAKEVEKRMAATRKKAEKNNEELGLASVKATKERKVTKIDPKDIQQGGGGSFKEGSAARPGNVQQGGGGSYKEGNAARSGNVQQGGGGSYSSSKASSGAKPSDFQQGGGGSFQKEGFLRKLFSKKK